MGRRNRRRPLGGSPSWERSSSCPTPHKVRYPSLREAQEAVKRLDVSYRPVPLLVYACPCGAWHLSSRRP